MAITRVGSRQVGNSSLHVSELSFGTLVPFANSGSSIEVDVELAKRLLTRCMKHGIYTFDTSESFGNGRAEIVLGIAIEQLGWKRNDYVIISKVFGTSENRNLQGLGKRHVVEGTLAILHRLRLKRLDVLIMHRPDPKINIVDTLEGVQHLLNKRKILWWGTCGWTVNQITQVMYLTGPHKKFSAPIVEQPLYNLLNRKRVEKEYFDLCDIYNLGLTTHNPMAHGFLSGKYTYKRNHCRDRLESVDFEEEAKELMTDANDKKIRAWKVIADNLEMELSQLAIAYCLSNNRVSSVIIGATSEAQIYENVQAVKYPLSDEVKNRIVKCRIMDAIPKRKRGRDFGGASTSGTKKH